MGDYARVYTDLKMADGPFKLSQYDFVFVLWTSVWCLGQLYISGVTCNFSETSEAIIQGAKLFFKIEQNGKVINIKAGAFTSYFCPFINNEIDLLLDDPISIGPHSRTPVKGANVVAGLSKKKESPFKDNEIDPLVDEFTSNEPLSLVKEENNLVDPTNEKKKINDATSSRLSSGKEVSSKDVDHEDTFMSDQGAGLKETALIGSILLKRFLPIGEDSSRQTNSRMTFTTSSTRLKHLMSLL